MIVKMSQRGLGTAYAIKTVIWFHNTYIPLFKHIILGDDKDIAKYYTALGEQRRKEGFAVR